MGKKREKQDDDAKQADAKKLPVALRGDKSKQFTGQGTQKRG